MDGVARRPRMLFIGGAPERLAPCAVLWRGIWCEVSPSRFGRFAKLDQDVDHATSVELDWGELDAFVTLCMQFDLVFCESPEALVLHGELERRGLRPPAILALEVHGLRRVRLLAQALRDARGVDGWEALLASSHVQWIAASSIQHTTLLEAGVRPEWVHRLDASVFVYEMMLPDARERLISDATIDRHLAGQVPADAVLIAGTGRRDPTTWLSAAALLPDIPFVSIGESAERVDEHRRRLGLAPLPNLITIPSISLEEYIASIRRARLCVVCIKAGTGDGGHSTVCLSHALGTAVVASRVPGVIDYVEDGRTARVVPPGDPRALATAIRWAWEDAALRARLTAGGLVAEAARRQVLERDFAPLVQRLAGSAYV